MTQFCVEEAVFEYGEQRDALRKANALDDEPGGVTALDPEWAEAQRKAQLFAQGVK